MSTIHHTYGGSHHPTLRSGGHSGTLDIEETFWGMGDYAATQLAALGEAARHDAEREIMIATKARRLVAGATQPGAEVAS